MKQVPRSRSPRRVGNSDQDRVLFHFMLICDNSKYNIIVFVAHAVENLHVSISWLSEVENLRMKWEKGGVEGGGWREWLPCSISITLLSFSPFFSLGFLSLFSGFSAIFSTHRLSYCVAGDWNAFQIHQRANRCFRSWTCERRRFALISFRPWTLIAVQMKFWSIRF